MPPRASELCFAALHLSRNSFDGATPIDPMNEPSGMRTPGSSAELAQPSLIFHLTMYGSGNSSRRKPKPGIWIVKPKRAGLMSRISTSSRSPGCGPFDEDRPGQRVHHVMSTWRRSSAVVAAVIWPSNASRV